MKFYRYFIFITIVNILGLACQITGQSELSPQNATPTVLPDPVVITGSTATPTSVTVKLQQNGVVEGTITPTRRPTFTSTPTASPSPTPSPTPTDTPIPGERMMAGNTALQHGRYILAGQFFASVASDPNADPEQQAQSLYWSGRAALTDENYQKANEIFAEFLEMYPTNPLTRSATFNQALALEAFDEYTPTLKAYQASILPNDPVADYIYERIGDLAFAAQDFPTAVEAYLAALDATNSVSFQVHLREGAAEAYLRGDDLAGALAQYQAILDVARIPTYRAKIMRLIGEAYEETGDLAQAQTQYQALLDTYPEATDTYFALINMVEAGMPVDEFQRGYVDYYGGDAYGPTVNALERYLATNPQTNVDETYWLLAWSRRAEGNYGQAITEFNTIINNYPQSTFWAEAHIQRARTLGWQGKLNQAITSYRSFAAQNPTASLAGEALWFAALLEFQDEQYAAAQQGFEELVTLYPANEYADDARYRQGLAAYLQADYAAAETAWAALLQDYPVSEFGRAASYWQAKALYQAGQPQKAQPLLDQLIGQSYNFYSLRARDLRNGQTVLGSVPLNLTPPTPAEQAEAEAWLADWLGLTQTVNFAALDRQILGDPAFIRAKALMYLGLETEAWAEYETVRSNWASNALALYQLSLYFKEQKAYRLSILTALDLVRLSPATDTSTVPRFIRRLIYPVYYQDLIVPRAEALNLDPALVFSLIRQESFFEANAHSFADARGLMQVIPPTGADIANRTNTQPYTADMLWLPYVSVDFGTWYLKEMLTYFNGHQFGALAAYNAGPGRVDRWLQTSEDFDIFVALIPLSEPQHYIRNIYLNLDAYQQIYGE